MEIPIFKCNIYTNIYITKQLEANTPYWMDTLPYTCIEINLSACVSLTTLLNLKLVTFVLKTNFLKL